MEDPTAATESNTDDSTKMSNVGETQETAASGSSALSADGLTNLVSRHSTAASSFAKPSSFKIQLVKDCTVLGDLTPEMWTIDHANQISTFLTNPSYQLLLVYIDQQSGLSLCNAVPSSPVSQFAYFIRHGRAVTVDNFHKVFQFGTVQGSHVDTLLRIMHGLYAPAFFSNSTWPDSILASIRENGRCAFFFLFITVNVVGCVYVFVFVRVCGSEVENGTLVCICVCI